MFENKAFRIGYGIMLIFIIIYLGSLIDWVFKPIAILVQTLFAPIVLAGVLFYLLRPLVNLLSKWIPRGFSILLLYLSGIALITALVFLIGPELQKQFNSLARNMPSFINEIREMFINLQQNEYISRFQQGDNFSFDEITSRFTDYLNEIVSAIGSNIASFIGFIANVLIILVIIPFVLFYMLKEGEKAPRQVLKYLPKKQQYEGQRILSDMDVALSSYIQGQIIVSFCVGVLVYIGYLIIGIDYPLVLALIAMFTNVIPFIGPWIGTFPGVIVGFLDSPLMALWVIIVVVVVQQIESNLISPQIMGRKLDIHPLTIILLLLVASRFAGLLGLLLAVPTYAVGKVIVSHSYRLWRLRSRTTD
ncbi:AI-2E family transporter [Halalkalibacter nanhaiisediminis]|uniref:Putative PurR-regulated permease PerM n=1 Tax=Halalkalibacter nanhaiisediminis TaxID=688079 RepID=A0A562QMA8_9BACI|nr:AI-2E family transporter [Halalkalibacter nanhaiisediminis]TWI57186.1 putative PurR-regulated permease PerM [Halalkalibacter nanhaiisediminis]